MPGMIGVLIRGFLYYSPTLIGNIGAGRMAPLPSTRISAETCPGAHFTREHDTYITLHKRTHTYTGTYTGIKVRVTVGAGTGARVIVCCGYRPCMSTMSHFLTRVIVCCGYGPWS